MSENIENRLRRWAMTASEPLPLITDGSVVVNVIEVDGPRSGDLRRLAALVASVRELHPQNMCMRKAEPHKNRGDVIVRSACGKCAECRMHAALAALDEASR